MTVAQTRAARRRLKGKKKSKPIKIDPKLAIKSKTKGKK
jgi:hypothetical protein